MIGKQDCVYESFADSKTRARDIGELDIQICGDCNNKLKSIKKDTSLSHTKMPKRTLAYHDILSTDHLPKLTMMEVASIAKYITCLQVIQLRELYGAHQQDVHGHIFSLRLNFDELKETFSHDVLQTDLNKFVNVIFVGNEFAWKTATRVMTQHKQIIEINVSKCIVWLRFLKDVGNPLYKHIDISTESEMIDLQLKMNAQVQDILNRRCMTDDNRTKILLVYTSSDTTRT